MRSSANQLKVTFGQYTNQGRKQSNQDRIDVRLPADPVRRSKGIAAALADGISSSSVGHLASERAVSGFLDDYYRTSESWSVRSSGERVLSAINSQLYAESRRSEFRYDKDRGYVCTLSAVVIKSRTAHVFHVGDARVLVIRDDTVTQLTEDHRLRLSDETSYLGRALGVNPSVDIDYVAHEIKAGDVILILSDGVHEHCTLAELTACIHRHGDDLNQAAAVISAVALENGSPDNLSTQILRIDAVPGYDVEETVRASSRLAVLPELKAGSVLDCYRIVRPLHVSHRSHVYLAIDELTQENVVLKIPSVEQLQDQEYLERFMLEEWVARRLDSAHVVQSKAREGVKSHLYLVSEYVNGQSLAQWMRDHPQPNLEAVRDIIEQVARGLQAFHRQEMVHQDLRPENILIDTKGTVKIIDFGATRVAGLEELSGSAHNGRLLGTVQYTAPEYFLGLAGTSQSDIYSLGVIAYQMLSGRLPYGARVPSARSRAAQRRLRYESVLDDTREIPVWIDDTLARAVHPDPNKRYVELSEFIFDLKHPNAEFLRRKRPPLFERNPALFWRRVSLVLTLLCAFLAWKLAVMRSRDHVETSPKGAQPHGRGVKHP